MAFVQHLFAREPETLKSQEEEWVQLEVKIKALQQQALEQEVASQRRLQVCSISLLNRAYKKCGEKKAFVFVTSPTLVSVLL